MKASRLIFILFLLCSSLFILGSVMKMRPLMIGSNLFLIPLLLVLYWTRARRIFFPVVVALMLLYVRDIFLVQGLQENPVPIMTFFLLGLFILLYCSISMLQRTNVDPVEYISFFIMYGFLAFLFIFVGDMVSEVIPSYRFPTYTYLLLLKLFLAISFTGYLLKSHYASLWLMVGAASLLCSELSLFFKLYILEDVSVNIFFPLFHVFAYYALLEFAVNKTDRTSLSPF